jgi:hypothetical protein
LIVRSHINIKNGFADRHQSDFVAGEEGIFARFLRFDLLNRISNN